MGPFEPLKAAGSAFPIGGAVTAGANAVSGIIGAITAKRQQKRANQFNIDMWKRQNLYNSPKEQMKRLQEAGLNPNLIYGSGGGNTGAASPAPQFEKLNDTGFTPVDIPSSVGSLQSFTDWDIKRATKDNLTARTELAKQEQLLKVADTAGKNLANTKMRTEQPYWSELAKLSTDALESSITKTQADTKYTLDQNERAVIEQGRNLMETAERILSMRSQRGLTDQQTMNSAQEFHVKKFQADLAKRGIDPSHPFYAKAVERFFQNLFSDENKGTGKGLLERLGDSLKFWK